MKPPVFYKDISNKYRDSISHFELIKHIVVDAALLCFIYYLLKLNSWGPYLAAQVLLPVFCFRSFGLMHDAVHSATSNNKFITSFIGYIAGAFCFLPFYPWKQSHLQHHYWAGNIQKDPVMKLVKDYKKEDSIKNSILNFAWEYWIPLLAILQHTVFWGLAANHFKEARTIRSFVSCVLSYVIPLFIYVVLSQLEVVSLANLAPAIVLYCMMVEVVNFPHHLQVTYHNGETRLPIWMQHTVSRTCGYPKWLSAVVLNNFNYHAEHHLFPHLPWYCLRDIHFEIKKYNIENYNYSERSQWIWESRNKPLTSVFLHNTKKYKKTS